MAPRLKVVFVLPAMTAGGAERVMITLLNGLDRTRFEPVLVSVSAQGPMRGLLDPAVPFHCLDASVKTCLPALFGKLRALRPDIVVSTMTHMNFAVLMLRPFFPRAKFIVREAITPSFLLEKYRRTDFLIKGAYRLLYPLADLVLSPARVIADELAALGVKKQDVLPNPVNTEKIRGAALPARTRPGIAFICAGRLHSQKGYDSLIAALGGLAIPNWHLSILGEGEERPRLEAQIAGQGLQDKISLPGHSDAPWPQIAAADCLLLPSRFEGLPNVALESLAAGTKVIAMDTAGGIAEIAAQAPQGAVKVVSSMSAFIAAMNEVKAEPAGACRPSLLPASYERAGVVARFTEILISVKRGTGV